VDRARKEWEERLASVETLLKSADLGVDRRRVRSLERAMRELAHANGRHLRTLAALGDFLIDGAHSGPHS
jgi:hypothetical protein